jgi:hypothetical protein
MSNTKACTKCGSPFPAERTKDYCMRDRCVNEAVFDGYRTMRVVHVHKQGVTVVLADDVRTTAGKNGRSA